MAKRCNISLFGNVCVREFEHLGFCNTSHDPDSLVVQKPSRQAWTISGTTPNSPAPAEPAEKKWFSIPNPVIRRIIFKGEVIPICPRCGRAPRRADDGTSWVCDGCGDWVRDEEEPK